MSLSLIIVESPTKAKTIGQFLGTDYKIMSSYGHVRDLPKSKLGIDLGNDFKPHYQLLNKAKPAVAELKNNIAKVNTVYLATDEDREGEAIAWHLMEVLKLAPNKTKRIVFHEITAEAMAAALKNPRAIDNNLVCAQEARRLLDRLYGYSVSPLLWQKIKTGLSAGRVQSIAIRLLVERERERLNFTASAFWGITAIFATGGGAEFNAELINLNSKRVANGKDFDDKSGQLKNSDVVWFDQTTAVDLVKKLSNQNGVVKKVETKPFVEKPFAPFTTSTLQQEANRKLRYSARRTMQLAQNLYENGYITYMRTDSTHLSEQAINAARQWIAEQYGKQYLSPTARQYQTKSKNAQEAHEAIRPAGANFKPLDQVKNEVDDDAYKIYELIWKRTIASQMAASVGQRIIILTAIQEAIFQATGKNISFDGYRRAYVEGSDDPEAELAEQERLLPQVKVGDILLTVDLQAKGHSTAPASRLTEAALVKELEARGIGRPSTYASIIDTIERREYVTKKGTTLVPTFTAFAVVNLMEKYLANLVDYNFTAQMEDELDDIAKGQINDKQYLKEFYFGKDQDGLRPTLEKVKDDIDPRVTSGVTIGEYNGKVVEVRIGRFGPFIKWDNETTRLPDDIAPADLTIDKAIALLKQGNEQPKNLGIDPVSGKNVYYKTGRFGPYVQLGESTNGATDKNNNNKPKMASLPKNLKAADITLKQALQLLSLPRLVGVNPANNESVWAANGRFGPYVKCAAETSSIPPHYNVLHITLEQALQLLKQDKKSARRVSEPIKELGIMPNTEKTVKLMNGRYGMYVTDGETNATLPKEISADNITLERAVELIKNKQGKPKKKPWRRKIK